MKDKVRETIEKYNLIDRDEHIVLGLSGGPDSVCLFHILRELGYPVHAVHVNHGLRESAQQDQAFVQKLCDGLGADCQVVTQDCGALAKAWGVTTEEAGRRLRYDAFRQRAEALSRQGIRAKVAVAHHADDQAETVLFRILRGTGTDGLAGMDYRRRDGAFEILRPLLDVTRADIEAYLKAHHLDYVTDETNEEALYTRNRIRLELLPLLREHYNENITAGLCRLAGVAASDKDYLWQQAEEAYRACLMEEESVDRTRALNRSLVAALHPAVRRRVLLKALRSLGLWEDVSYERLLAMEAQMESGSSTKVIQLPRDYTVTFAFDRILLRHERAEQDGCIALEVSLLTDEGDITALRERLRTEGYPADNLYFDAGQVAAASGIPAEKLAESLVTRTRQPGDFTRTRGGRKTLKKLLGEMKIPADERDRIPFLAAGRCILAVIPGNGRPARYADALSVNHETQQVLACEVCVKTTEKEWE